MFSSWFARSFVVAMLAFTLAAGDALADRGGRGGGGRSGGGGGGGGGGRSSFSGGGGGNRGGGGGGGGGGRSSFSGGGGGRSSFSGGGGGGGRSSFSGGGGGGRSSFSGGGGNRGGGGGGGGSSMSRSFSGGGGGRSSMSRSLSPQSRQSFSGGGGGGGSSINRSFSSQGRSSISGGGGGGGGGRDLSSRSLRSMNRDSSDGNASLGRSLGNAQTSGGSGNSNRGNYRPLRRETFQMPTTGDRSVELRSQAGRGGNDGVNRANWMESLSNQGDRGRGNNNVGNGDNNFSRRNLGQPGSPTLSQQLGGSSNERGERSASRRGQFDGREGGGRPTNEQVRNFLSLREGGQNKNSTTGIGDADRFNNGVRRVGNRGSAGEFTGSMQDRALRNRDGNPGGGDGPGNGLGRRDGDARGKGDGRGDGDGALGRGDGPGGRGDNSNSRGPDIGDGGRGNRGSRGDRGDRGDGKFGDGKFADGKFGDGKSGDGRPGDGKFGDGKFGDGDRNGGGRRGDRGSDGIGRGDGRGGDGRGDWRDGKGDGRRWRGGELGKGDHRDWSGKWKDGKRFDTAHHIRDDWHGRKWRNRHDIPFHGDWWRHGHGRWHGHRHWDHWGWWAGFYGRPFFWWDWCSAPRLTTWVGFNWGTPYYWDYGPGEYINCYNNVIYVNGQWFEPAPVYYQRTIVLAQSAPDFTPQQAQQIEWLPLGVFAVSRDGVVDNNELVQLAVTKDGVIGGTVMNQATGTTFDVEGTVDKKTQRAVWAYKDDAGREIAMETSVFNLTQPEATAMVHYGPNDMKVVELVRLEQPDADANGAAGAAVNVAKPPLDKLGTEGQAAAAAEGALPAPAVPEGTLPAPQAVPEPAPLPIPPAPTNPPVTPVK